MRFKNVFSVFNRRRSLSTGKSAIVRQEDFNDLYRLANYAGKGTLVNILRNDGPSVLFDYMACVLPEYISAHPHANGYWLPTRRGEHGETLLHVLLICNTSDHTRIAIDLLRLHPLLARDVMLSKEYGGVSPLHLSIAYCNQKMIDALLDLKVDVNQRATGSFFAISNSSFFSFQLNISVKRFFTQNN